MERKRRVGVERREGIGARKRQRGAGLIIMEVERKQIEDSRRYRNCETAKDEVQLFGPTCFVSGIFRSMTVELDTAKTLFFQHVIDTRLLVVLVLHLSHVVLEGNIANRALSS